MSAILTLSRPFSLSKSLHRLLTEMARLARIVIRDLLDSPCAPPMLMPPPPYRPERHYMRGPGPKWHAKHGRLPHCGA